MPANPQHSSRGGDVPGETPIDVTHGEAIKVAKASFDPGYELGNSLGHANKHDLIMGYCSYGKELGE